MKRWGLPVILATVLAAMLSGCFIRSVDELYAPPQQSEEYYELQSEIENLMVAGTTYAAPASGANQQAVQLADLDGDEEDEAIVFVKASGEKPLKVYIFDRTGETFSNVAVIEGDGNSFSSVEYAQIDGEPGLEIVLGRQVSDQVLQAMSVYALRDDRVLELMSASYTAYTTVDLDQDGNTDLFLLRFNPDESSGVAEYYRYVDNQIEREPEALMSTGVEAVRRLLPGRVEGGVPAVFVASIYDTDDIITDVFALRDETFTNITTEGTTGVSAQTVRNYYVYSSDLDSDGVIELPQPRQLPTYGESEDAYWIIDWYSLNIDGQRHRKVTTYHNYSNGWFVTLPDEWSGQLTITRDQEASGVRGYTFAKWNGYVVPPDPIFTIYAFSGEDRNELANADGRFVLGEKGDVTYAASMGTSDFVQGLTREALQQMFNFIHIDWNNGEV